MVSKITVVSVLLLIFFTAIFLFFDTSLCFSQTTSKPIKVCGLSEPYSYRHMLKEPVNGSGIRIGGFGYDMLAIIDDFTIADVTVKVNDAFHATNNSFTFSFSNFSRIDFMYNVTDEIQAMNTTKLAQYVNENKPDLAVMSPLISQGNFTFWSQLQQWGLENEDNIPCESLLNQVSFNRWEGDYYIDNGYTSLILGNDSYLKMETSAVTWQIYVPNTFSVDNTQDFAKTSVANGVLLTKQVTANETFHLALTDNSWNTLMAFVKAIEYFGIPSSLIGTIAPLFLTKKKRKPKKQAKKYH